LEITAMIVQPTIHRLTIEISIATSDPNAANALADYFEFERIARQAIGDGLAHVNDSGGYDNDDLAGYTFRLA
jgi:hypothetical protein